MSKWANNQLIKHHEWISIRPLCGYNVTKADLPSNLEVVTTKKINQILREDHGNLSPC